MLRCGAQPAGAHKVIQLRPLLGEHFLQKPAPSLIGLVGEELLKMLDIRSCDEFLHLPRPRSHFSNQRQAKRPSNGCRHHHVATASGSERLRIYLVSTSQEPARALKARSDEA